MAATKGLKPTKVFFSKSPPVIFFPKKIKALLCSLGQNEHNMHRFAKKLKTSKSV